MSNDLKMKRYDALVIGAGFAGLYMLHRLRQLGFNARVIEAGEGVGGTWYWNCYPGARCDVESMQYSYSFDEGIQQEWVWTERYPKQEEIFLYINHVADRLDLRKDIQFRTRVTKGSFDASHNQWTVQTDTKETFQSSFLITASGCLSASRVPEIEGLNSFKGDWYHTGQWPKKEVDFAGKRVGVIGTGSSGMQIIPVIAQTAKSVVVFQRTPNFTIPAWNKPLSVEDQNQWKANYAEHRAKARNTRSGILYEYSSRAGADVSAEEREQEYERRWLRGGANFTHAFNDIFLNKQSNDWAADFVRKQIKRIVKNPEVAQMLTPTDHPIGTKRICVDTDYYETFNLPHVKLVDVRKSPIQSISATQLHTQDQAHDLDMIVFATGFDAVTGAIERMNLSNPAYQTIQETWKSGPRTYLGLMSHGFPNLFFITGPGSPSILTNVIVSIEQHVDLIARCLQHMKSKGHRRIEASNEAQEKWVQKVNDVANDTLFPLAQSWYMGANIPGKPRVFLPFVGGFGPYSQLCEEVIAQDYTGFNFS